MGYVNILNQQLTVGFILLLQLKGQINKWLHPIIYKYHKFHQKFQSSYSLCDNSCKRSCYFDYHVEIGKVRATAYQNFWRNSDPVRNNRIENFQRAFWRILRKNRTARASLQQRNKNEPSDFSNDRKTKSQTEKSEQNYDHVFETWRRTENGRLTFAFLL